MTETLYHPTAERLEAFIEGGLEAGDRVVLESHVLGCPRCQTEVEQLRSLFAALARLERFSPKDGFVNRVMAHVRLPDPWYVRAGHYLQTFTPRTSRSWAFASAFLALPLIGLGTIMLWVLSKPYVTGEGLLAFTWQQISTTFSTLGRNLLSSAMQSDVTLALARLVDSVIAAGLAGAGTVAVLFAALTAFSAWVLYQNLFRHQARRSNYASYSF
ncbi:MAG TPA: zf-HC2 domain-containing protein [Longimicrobiales bacterium]|nr:zf-HC2 domain-containing protein [Longimicrobiales bacterium]